MCIVGKKKKKKKRKEKNFESSEFEEKRHDETFEGKQTYRLIIDNPIVGLENSRADLKGGERTRMRKHGNTGALLAGRCSDRAPPSDKEDSNPYQTSRRRCGIEVGARKGCG